MRLRPGGAGGSPCRAAQGAGKRQALPPPVARAGAATLPDGRVLVVGGVNDSGKAGYHVEDDPDFNNPSYCIYDPAAKWAGPPVAGLQRQPAPLWLASRLLCHCGLLHAPLRWAAPCWDLASTPPPCLPCLQVVWAR